MSRIYSYDTTLRDGAQCEGISFSCDDKLDILRRLDAFGMDFVKRFSVIFLNSSGCLQGSPL